VDGDYDFASNGIRRTFPRGLDASIMKMRCLEEAWREATLPAEREHVTLFLYSRPQRFRLGSYTQAQDLSALQWSVDTADDFRFACRVYQDVYARVPAFGFEDVLSLISSEAKTTSDQPRFTTKR
jgi:spore coat polysaccharide biosynthesis protein SpsF